MILSMGTKLKIGANSIAELSEITGLELSADTIDTTNLSSTGSYREFIQGMKDAGEVSVSGYFNPNDTVGQKALYDAFGTGAATAFTILYPSTMGAEWDFTGIVTGFSTSAATEDAVGFEATIKVTGQPSLGLTASGGLTALSLTATGGTLSPAFANGTYNYSFSGITGTTLTVTATAANHTIQLFVDGAMVQTLTSAVASSAIAFSAIGSKMVDVIVYEPGKTTKVYSIVTVKTA